MTDTFARNAIRTEVSASTEPMSQRDIMHLWRWVNSWLKESILDLDTMIVTAPAELRSKFTGYSAMEETIQVMVQQTWASIAKRRLLSA
jgi:hypothetical protein